MYTHTHTFCEVCGQRSSRSDEVYGAKLQKWAGIPSEDAEERERGEEEEGTERAGPSVSLPSRTVLRRRFIRGGGAVAQPRLRWLFRLCRGGEAAGRSRSLCQPPSRPSELRGEHTIQKAQERPSPGQGMPVLSMSRTSRR